MSDGARDTAIVLLGGNFQLVSFGSNATICEGKSQRPDIGEYQWEECP